MIKTRQQEASQRRGNRLPPFLLALVAVFLLVGLGVKGLGRDATLTIAPQTLLAYSAASFGGSSMNQISAASKVAMPETPELLLLAKTGVKASTPPVNVTPQVLGAILGGTPSDIHPEVFRYIVEPGDTPASIAEKFDISLQTVLWANELTLNSVLTPGKELIILPLSGTLHLVRAHDTLSEIALWYKADREEIARFNGLKSSQEIFAGDLLIIPGGVMPKALPQGRLTPLANAYFIYPVPASHRISQGLHAFNAVDLANGECGEPVYAAAGGTIQRTGFHAVGGNFVRILHPNGVVTYYGHLSKIAAVPGNRVFQGEIIGYTGYTGHTIPAGPAGCHVHFEVRGAKNPFAK